MNFKKRSSKTEFLDEIGIPFSDISNNMKELNVINTWLGGHAITITGLSALLGKTKKITVCEIGCGGGDNIFALHKWCAKNGVSARFIGIDLKPECIQYAKERQPQHFKGEWIVNDFEDVVFDDLPDVVYSSLFCHHFANEKLVTQFRWMAQHSKMGFFINDLHRHAIAYHLIKCLTAIFSSSYLVKNDAPLSVARGFKKLELQYLLDDAGLQSATVKWKWAFRYLAQYTHAR